jgi:FkbM family methyltransferase
MKSASEAALKAFEMRPSRVEPLADLARHYRERGMNEVALMFAKRGLEIPPSDDMLFVETFGHEELRNTYAISGFYAKNPRDREKAAALCDDLALDRSVSCEIRDLARNNLYWHLKSIADLAPSWQARRLKFAPPDGYFQMTPSITRHGTRLMVAERTVNYWLTDDDKRYNTPNDAPIHTRTFLLELNPETLEESVHGEILLPTDFPAPVFEGVQGFEDARLFSWRGDLWTSSTVRDQNRDGYAEQWLALLCDLRMCGARAMRPPGERRHEKNWIPLVDGNDLRFVYLCDPTRIVDHDGCTIKETTPEIAADNFRGNTQAIPFAGGWLAVIHWTVWQGQWPKYRHRFVWFDADYKLQKTSPGFAFPYSATDEFLRGYQYAMGLCWHPDERRLVISYQVDERESWIATVEADDIRSLLGFATPAQSRGFHLRTQPPFKPYIVRDRTLLDWRFDFWISDATAQAWYTKTDHTEPDKVWCLQRIKPGMRVFDCGAHHGQMTVLFSKAVGSAGHVCAWEALPENAVVIERNCLLNHCGNVTIYPYAIGSTERYLEFAENGGNALPGKERSIYTVSLDCFPHLCSRVDFIKIDVEGAELSVLSGAIATLRSFRPFLDIELHLSTFSDRAAETRQITTILEDVGYRFSYPDLSLDNTHIYCEP